METLEPMKQIPFPLFGHPLETGKCAEMMGIVGYLFKNQSPKVR